MNERIKELCIKSGAYEHYEVNEGVNGDELPMQKFAELIVLECMDVFGKDLPEPGDGKLPEVINRICNVAEHFGVDNERTS
jgi:hypothetical protein